MPICPFVGVDRLCLGPGRTGKVDRTPRKARAISKGGSHPDNCRLVGKLGRGIRDLVLAMLWAAPRRGGEDRALPRGESAQSAQKFLTCVRSSNQLPSRFLPDRTAKLRRPLGFVEVK